MEPPTTKGAVASQHPAGELAERHALTPGVAEPPDGPGAQPGTDGPAHRAAERGQQYVATERERDQRRDQDHDRHQPPLEGLRLVEGQVQLRDRGRTRGFGQCCSQGCLDILRRECQGPANHAGRRDFRLLPSLLPEGLRGKVPRTFPASQRPGNGEARRRSWHPAGSLRCLYAT
ncbi:MAG: hypothetical protein J2P36_06900 [Ktedonobacteraceae bacterium]|nr:hypothetical protein [Ktedonobacteraceae bacterium]